MVDRLRRQEIRARALTLAGFIVPGLILMVLAFFLQPSFAPSVERWKLVASIAIFLSAVNGFGVYAQVRALLLLRISRTQRSRSSVQGIQEMLSQERLTLIDQLIELEGSGEV